MVGYAYISGDVANHAFRTAANRPINPATDDLGTLAGTWASFGLGINASGQVVGYALTSDNAATLPFLYSGGVIYDLNNLIPVRSGWDLIVAYGINYAGQIAGIGTHNGLDRPFLLTPAQSKEQCKKGGWKNFGFKNQGQCIQFVNTGK